MGNSKSHDLILREMPQRVKELHNAVMTNDRVAVKTLVQDGVNVNFPWYNPGNPSVKDGSTPLIIAVSLNHLEIVKALVSGGAYINKCDRNGCTPVYKAAFHGRPVLIEYLSSSGADVNLSDYMGKTPLYMCVNNCIVHSYTGRLAVQKLLTAGAIVDKHDRCGQAPIHIAAHWKLQEIVALLIRSKSNVNMPDKYGRTPLYICVSSLSTKLYLEDLRHQMPCVITLWKAGADMLNFIEWLHYKGSGLPKKLMAEFKDGPEMFVWYKRESTRPQTLRNLCRKSIQKAVTRHGGQLTDKVKKLPLPTSLQLFMSRKMFYREVKSHYYYSNASDGNSANSRAVP